MQTRHWIMIGAVVVAGAVFWFVARDTSSTPAREGEVRAAASPAKAVEPTPALPTPDATPLEAATAYPIDLEDLRARIPNNRYWTHGSPTSDPAIAKERAARAERDNALFGRTQTGEASEAEIRAYYAERRRISEDYLELSLLVLAGKGAQLPERDRGMFELSAQLHRAKLTQIERDLADALARRKH